MNPARLLALALSITALGCTELGQFRTDPDEVYRGTVIGVDDGLNCEAGTSCSVFRRGFSPDTVLEMRFDPAAVDSQPGTLRTRGQACGDEVLDDTPMLAIPPIAHDELGLYELPGGGRVRNYIFSLRPSSGPLMGRDVVAFVSLLRSGNIEVRILSGAGIDECDPTDCAAFAAGQCDFFGVFHLEREPLTP